MSMDARQRWWAAAARINQDRLWSRPQTAREDSPDWYHACHLTIVIFKGFTSLECDMGNIPWMTCSFSECMWVVCCCMQIFIVYMCTCTITCMWCDVKDNFSIYTRSHNHPLSFILTQQTVDCYNTSDLGQSYTGRRAITQNGEACEPWSNTHLLFNASLYPELRGAENFCRNPGRLREKPWCFTAKDSWNYCDLPTNCTGEIPKI